MTQYWFQRVTPGGRGLRVLSWQGGVVLAGFVGAMVLGGVSMLLLGLADQMFWGILCFATLAIAGAGTFLWAATTKSAPAPVAGDKR